MDSCIQHPNCVTKFAKPAWRAKQVSQIVALIGDKDINIRNSASPLNGEAAELWDKDPAEFQKKVTARHCDIDDE